MPVNNTTTENTAEQLPEWMRQAKRGLDWGALLMIGFAVFAAWSFVNFGNLSAATGNEASVFRITNTIQALREGVIFPRWSAYTLNGYGAPIPHFYPAGAIYLGGVIGYLFSLDAVIVLQGLYVLAYVVAGSMVYTFVTQRTNALAGLVSGILYLTSPHIMTGTSQVIGDISLTFGVALLPALLWATNRLLQRGHASDFAFIALITALMSVTTPIMMLQGIIAVLVLLIVEFSETVSYRKVAVIFGAIALGLILIAIFWLPAIVDATSVTWYPPMIDAPEHIVTLKGLLGLHAMTDLRSVVTNPSFAVGWMMWITQVLFIAYFARYRTQTRLSISFFILACSMLVLIFWVDAMQSEWMILVILCFAISGSSIIQTFQLSRHLRLGLALGIVSGTILFSVSGWVLPITNIYATIPTPSEQITYEQQGWGYAGLPAGYALPSNLSPDIAYTMPLDRTETDELDRLISNQLLLVAENSHNATYNVNANRERTLEYRRAYFNLWSASLTNQSLMVSQSDNQQLAILLPETTNDTLRISINADSTLWAGRVISIIGIMLILIITGYRLRIANDAWDDSLLLTKNTARMFGSILLFALVTRGITSQIPQPLQEVFMQEQSPINYERPFSIQNTLQFVDFKRVQAHYQRGDVLRMDTLWQLNQSTETQFVVDLRLIQSETQSISYQTGFQHIGYIPTDRWQSDVLINHLYTVTLPETLETGNYILELAVFDCNAPCDRENIAPEQAIAIIPLPTRIIIN